ncbi:hypothetical protein OH77DRAFT_1592450 [Trametes cingulata]|nr:hypothetical protein OH77DRAFT_1592450 [Trametes cingulata]
MAPRALYPLSVDPGITAASNGLPATVKALSIIEVREAVVSSLSPIRQNSEASPGRLSLRCARATLNALLRTSTAFFHMSAEMLWSRLDDSDVLFAVLIGNQLSSAHNFAHSGDILRCILLSHTNLEAILDHTDWMHFRFYASCVQDLRTSAGRLPSQVIDRVIRLLPPGDVLFPSLRSVSWCDGHSPLIPFEVEGLRRICGPKTTTVAIFIVETSSLFQRWLRDALRLLSGSPASLQTIDISASCAMSRCYGLAMQLQDSALKNFPLACCVDAPAQEADILASRAQLELLQNVWNDNPGGAAALSVVDNVAAVTTARENYPELESLHRTSYIAQYLFSSLHSLELTLVVNQRDVVSLEQPPRLVHVIKPLLQKTQLRTVHVEVVGAALSLPGSDLVELGRAWVQLKELSLVHRLGSTAESPVIDDLHTFVHCCSEVWRVHIPCLRARSTSSGTPSPSTHPRLTQLSSSVLLTDGPLHLDAVAEVLLAHFPSLLPVRSNTGVDEAWDELSKAINRALAEAHTGTRTRRSDDTYSSLGDPQGLYPIQPIFF